MSILTKEEISRVLFAYYQAHYGEQEHDRWYEQPAANVWVYGRAGRIITLKCHILTGRVGEQAEGD